MKARRLLPWLAIGLLAAYAVLVEPRWVVQTTSTLVVPRWQGPDALKVAVAADWHVSHRAFWRVMTPERARAIVADINAAQPDVVLLPGDFFASEIDDPSQAVPAQQVVDILGSLRAKHGVFAVLGNHDWWQDAPGLAAALQARGITVLENEAVLLPGTPLWVVGIGDDFTGHAQPRKALARVPPGAQVLVAMHDPATLKDLPALSGLLVAGHTHGGQVSLPFYGALQIPTAAPREWAYGWVRHGPNTMYVTSGLGVSILPVRFNMRPEWVLVTVRAQ
ncbi:MAG: metallophosphoesterase [Burkholderiales bacterium]|nr:metallophosphoesterase [Burkholderiales bacterium]